MPIQVHWQTTKRLVVRTKLRFLEALTTMDNYDGKLSGSEIKEVLKRYTD